MKSLKHLGAQLREARLERGWTMQRVADETKTASYVTVNSVALAEHMDASQYPSLRVLATLCELYGLEIKLTEITDGQEAEGAEASIALRFVS